MDYILNLTQEEVRFLINLLDDRTYFLFKRKTMLRVSSQQTVELRRSLIADEEKLLKSIYKKI